MNTNSDTYQKGKWIKVSDRLPKNIGIKLTMTKDKSFGLASFVDDEWIQFLPTFLGEVFYWCEFIDDNGQEIEFVIDQPEPELCGGA